MELRTQWVLTKIKDDRKFNNNVTGNAAYGFKTIVESESDTEAFKKGQFRIMKKVFT